MEGDKLACLQQFLKSQSTRASLLNELEDAFKDHLRTSTANPQPTPTAQPNGHSDHSCRTESTPADYGDVSEDQLTRIIEITTLGLLEVRDEISIVRARLNDIEGGGEQENLIGRIEQLEQEKLGEIVQRNQLRKIVSLVTRSRLREMEEEGDELIDESEQHNRSQAITESDSRIGRLISQINEILEEIRIEIMDLSSVES